MRTIIGSTIFFCLLGAEISFARHLGTVGRVYPVVEPDALAEIREAAARVDWDKTMDREKTLGEIKRFRPDDLHSLPATREDKMFQVDMTFTLENDISDGKGGVLYPKGFSFNPLDYLSLTSVLVVIDAGDRRQVDWFKASPYITDYRTRLVLSGSGYYDLSEELDRPVFYLMDTVASRLHLAAVPSIVRQSGRMLEVTEVVLSHD